MTIRNDHPMSHLCNIPREINYMMDDKYLENTITITELEIINENNIHYNCQLIINNEIVGKYIMVFSISNIDNEITNLYDDLKYIIEFPNYHSIITSILHMCLLHDENNIPRGVSLGKNKTNPVRVSMRYAKIVIIKLINHLKDYKNSTVIKSSIAN